MLDWVVDVTTQSYRKSPLLSMQMSQHIDKMSSAYKIIKYPICELHSLPRSSIYRANRNGDNTEPCPTPKSIPKTHDHTLFHFMQEKQPESKFSNNSNKISGIRLFMSFMYSAWWLFTLSKALERSIAQRFTVLPAITKRLTILQTLCCVATSKMLFKSELIFVI